MTMQSVATRLAAVPERAIEALASVPTSRWRPRRSWLAGDIIAVLGLGLAVGIAIGLLLQGSASGVEDADSAPGEVPGQYT